MINLILFCFGTACLTLFLDMCFQKGMIFRKYYNWISYHFYLPVKKKGKILIPYKPRWSACPTIENAMQDLAANIAEPKIIIRPVFIENKYRWLFKLLGGCTYCCGTWIYLILYMATIGEIATSILLGIGFNYVFIKALEKL